MTMQAEKRVIGNMINKKGEFVPIFEQNEDEFLNWRSPYAVFPIALILAMLITFAIYSANHYKVQNNDGTSLFIASSEGSRGFYHLNGFLVFKSTPVTTYNGDWFNGEN